MHTATEECWVGYPQTGYCQHCQLSEGGNKLHPRLKNHDNSCVNTLNHNPVQPGKFFLFWGVDGGCAAKNQIGRRPRDPDWKNSESKFLPEIGGFQTPEKISHGFQSIPAWGFGSAATPGVADKLLRAKFRRRRAKPDGRPWLEGVAGLARWLCWQSSGFKV